jgi:hypothetical protein
LLEVDVQALPRRVRVEDLASESTLHELTAAVGKRVYRLNTTGLTYCIPLKPVAKFKLPERVELPLQQRPRRLLTLPIGVTATGDKWVDLNTTGHVLVAGTTRAGKSNWLLGALAWLVLGREPEDVQVAIVDPKGVDFTAWATVPHLIAPIATEAEAAGEVLAQLSDEITSRQRAFARSGARNLTEHNRASEAKLPQIMVVIDEFTDLVLAAGLKSPLFADLTRLVSKGAAFGVTAILATQHPKSEVLNTLIRSNLTTRIAFRCNEPDQSRVIIGDGAAAKLPHVPGRAIVKIADRRFVTQTYYLDPTRADELALAMTPAPADTEPEISETTARLVRFALRQFAGSFTIGKLAKVFDCPEPEDGGRRITRWTIQKTGEELASKGLLTEPASVTDARKVTPQLAQLVETPA